MLLSGVGPDSDLLRVKLSSYIYNTTKNVYIVKFGVWRNMSEILEIDVFTGKGTRQLVLQAAMIRFSTYGYKRTSMEDIAQQAEVSRPTLYAHFKNKKDILRSVSEGIHKATLADVESALGLQAPLDKRLHAAFWAWSKPFMGILFGSPHGAELIGASSLVASSISADSRNRFQALVAKSLKKAQKKSDIDLRTTGLSIDRAAEFLVLSLNGLSAGEAPENVYKRRLTTLVRVFLTACHYRQEGRH